MTQPLLSILPPDEARIRLRSMLPGVSRPKPRFRVQIELSATGSSTFCRDLDGTTWLFVATHNVKAVGTKIDLLCALPTSEAPIVIDGEVDWVHEYSGAADDSPPGMGVRVISMDAASGAVVEAYLAACPPLFFSR